MNNFACDCGRPMPDAIVVKLLTSTTIVTCSGCKKKWDRNTVIDHGATCPTCLQRVKRDFRRFNSGMARVLIFLHLQPSGEWIHRTRFDSISREGCQLAWWGMVEDKINADSGKRSSGLWRITDRGREFAVRKISVSPIAVRFRGRTERFEGEPEHIDTTLGKKFNYAELMARGPATV